MINTTVQTYGRIDCAFNNAGVEGVREKTENYPEQAFDRVLDTNLKGMWLCIKYEVKQMMKQELVINDPEKWKNKPVEACFPQLCHAIIIFPNLKTPRVGSL